MKAGSMCVKVFLAMVLIMGVYAGTAAAQVPAGLTIWQDSPWQLSAKVKGYEFDDPASPPSDKVSGSVKFQAVMNVVQAGDPLAPTGVIEITLYEAGKDACEISAFGTLVLNFVAGDSTAFIAESDPDASTQPIKGLFYFSGKESKKGWSGKVETLAAYLTADFDPFEGIGATIKGSIKDLKCTLPAPPPPDL